MSEHPQFPEAELARLADGSLPTDRAAEIRAEAERVPALAKALAEQQQAVSMLRSADDVSAPDPLRLAVDRQIRLASRRRRPALRFSFALPAVSAVAVAAAAVVLVLGGGSGAGPTLQQTAHLALARATYPAPSELPGDTGTLNASAAGIAFPYWQRTVGWRALGSRSDRVAGRLIRTVFYGGPGGGRVGYAIVAGPAVAVSGGTSVTHGRVEYQLLREGPGELVTWRRAGHTCVIAGLTVSPATLLRLASADT